MSELEQLSNLILTILSLDNEARQQNEELLKQSRKTDLNKYVYVFLCLLNESPKVEVRMFCVVHLRSVLSSFAGAVLDASWIDLSSETQKLVKTSLFEILNKETEKVVRKGLCDLIGELGATILTYDESDKEKLGEEAIEWSGLMQNLLQYLSSGNDEFIISALRILSVLFLYAAENYLEYQSELIEVFRKNLEHQNYYIKAAAIQAMVSFLETIDSKECKPYAELIPLILVNVVQIIHENEDLGVEVLSNLQDLVETEHRIFKVYFKQLFEAIKAINSKKIESQGIRESSLEIMVIFLEKSPRYAENNQDILKDLLEMIFTYMVTTEEDPDDEWLKPPEGFIEHPERGEAEDTPVRFAMHLIDRLIACIGEEITIPLLSKIILQMVKYDDWRYKSAALMALSQVGEYVSQVSEMDPIVQFILNFMTDMHPKVRYAGLYAIGQIADDMHPEFQQRFHNVILTPLINSFKDNVPRVAACGLAAITNFLEGSPKAAVAGRIVEILEPCLGFLNNGISLIKENAMSTISALAEASFKDFTQYWQSTAELIFNILKTYTSKEYKQLRGQAIECLTLIGAAVGKEEFKKAAHEIIQTMLEIQLNHAEETDPQKSYLLSGWQRICIVLREDFIPYLKDILPSLFKMIEDIIEADEKKRFGSEEEDALKVQSAFMGKPEKKQSVNTSETEDLLVALNMINNFVVELRKGYLPYVEKTSNIVEPLLSYSSNEEIRITSAKIFPGLVRVVKESGHSNAEQFVKTLAMRYTKMLWKAIDAEIEPRVISMIIYSMREIIHIAERHLNEAEVKQLCDRIYKALKQSNERKNTKQQWVQEDEIDEDERDELEDDTEMEEELHVALAGLIGVLFETHKELTLPFVKLIYTDMLPNVLANNMSSRMHKFGLYLIDDMIEHLGVELIPDEWPYLSEAIINFSTNKYSEVRQAAVYGIGALAEKSKEYFKQLSDYCLKAIVDSLQVPKKNDELDSQYGRARDHSIVALGKIIKNQSGSVSNLPEVIKLWLSHLPIRYDKKEARAQHELLVDIILASDATLIFGEKGENMPHVMKIFAEIVNTKLSTDDIKKKILQVIQLLASNENTQPLAKQAIASLDDKLQLKLKEIMATQ